MRRIPSLMLAATLLVLASGCASSGGMKNQPSSYRSTLDSETMQSIELQAQLNGASVYWINPPRKAKAPAK